jgi:hypothetical protein
MPAKELPQDKPRLRHTDDGNWFWCSKTALRTIRENIDNPNEAASCASVYISLCEIANEKGNETFCTTHAFLSLRCGFGPRTVRSRIADLRQLKLIGVVTPTKRAPSTYSLFSTENKQTQIGNSFRRPLPRSKDSKEGKDKVQGCLVPYARPTERECVNRALNRDESAEFASGFFRIHDDPENDWTTGEGDERQPIKYWQPCQDAFIAKCTADREGEIDFDMDDI